MGLMKRNREGDNGEVEAMAMANCLVLLSRFDKNEVPNKDRVFHCKTCDKTFSSFQALGGHRASHKRPRVSLSDHENSQVVNHSPLESGKTKAHACSICGLEFPLGQALGGHMRRHRAAMAEKRSSEAIPVLKRSNSKRVLSLDLNLGLAPYEMIDLKAAGDDVVPRTPFLYSFF